MKSTKLASLYKDVTVVIPSSSRPKEQLTLAHLPDEIRNITYLAVPSKQAKDYSLSGTVMPVPDSVKGISKTRKWLVDTCPTRFLMMLDDDMTFCYRPDMENPKLVTLSSDDKEASLLFQRWRELGEEYLHVGLSPRQGNNREKRSLVTCRRMCNAYLYDVSKVRSLVTFGRTKVMEDFDVTLQLLRMGHPNAMIYQWCWNQRSSNARGGCSDYRTSEMQTEAAYMLAKLHPGFVKVIKKTTKSAWEGMKERTDVVVSWQKAYLSSQR